jgi:hypothetical protein
VDSYVSDAASTSVNKNFNIKFPKKIIAGRSYKTKTKITCRSNNIIYCIQDAISNMREKAKGMPWTDYRNISIIAVVVTTQTPLVTTAIAIVIKALYVLEFVHVPPDHPQAKSTRLERKKESTWIHRLRTMSPLGLNIKDNTW